MQGEVPNMNEELPIAIRRTKRDPKPSNQLKESLEYLSRPVSNTADTNLDTWTPKTYKDAMKRPDLWWEPMEHELEMLKEKGVFEVVPRPQGKNVIGSKWVYAVK